jgi:RNA polymerase sigma-70 factor (ECF subfamily)
MSYLRKNEQFRVSPSNGYSVEAQCSEKCPIAAIVGIQRVVNQGSRMLETFSQHRAMAFRIAYSILGCVSDAEDMVQELWLRWQRQDRSKIQSAQAWIGSAMKRLCIDQIRSARRQREHSYGISVPEPLIGGVEPETNNPADQEYLLEIACSKVLETLRPVERVVFMMYAVFGYDNGNTAALIGKGSANCRQILHRAKTRLSADSVVRSPNEQARRLAKQIAVSSSTGELAELLALLGYDGVPEVAVVDSERDILGLAQHAITDALSLPL